MESIRKQFIDDLVLYSRNSGHVVVVVFDGWRNGRGHETRVVYGGITVIYSGIGERADNVIKRIISSERRKWIVVSSDRDIESFAWRMDGVPIKSEQFREALYKSLDDHVQRQDDISFSEKHRGHGKTSKKEREISRVLNKL